MSGFAIRNPYFITVICLMILVVGISSVARMPVDLFPPINIPVVVVATFYSGMPPEQVEVSITGRFERFFTLGSGIEHIESRSLPGVSLIKIFFQPGTNADSAVTMISNLAMANLRRLPPGTLPPVVLKFDASSLPVCLITVKGEGLSESVLRDTAQYAVRNQIASVPGASIPPPFGGRYRQIMVYVDPLKLEAYQMSPMDVVRIVNDSNLILPAGDVQIGSLDYNIYTNSQLRNVEEINLLPLKTINGASVRVADVGFAKDAQQIQYNIVRVDGQKSVYLPILKQGGDTNTIAVVDGIKAAVARLFDIPKELITKVVFDQSLFVRKAIETLLHEGAIGLVLTSLMILLFLGSLRATVAVFLSIPLSALATFMALFMGGSSINTMILGGLALVFSRLIDNSVVVLENIFRHLEMGESQREAAEKGGSEVALPVLAATLTTAVVFFPVTFLYGVSRFLFSALALSVVLSLIASYFVALTVVPLFCSRLLKGHSTGTHSPAEPAEHKSLGAHFNAWFNRWFERMLNGYERMVRVFVTAAKGSLAGLPGRLSFQSLHLSADWRRLLSENRRWAVCHQCEGAFRNPARCHGAGDQEGGDHCERGSRPGRSRHDRVQHWCHARLLGDLYQQRGPAHGFCAGESYRRTPRGQLRVYEPCSAAYSIGPAPFERLFPVRGIGGRCIEPGTTGADRHPGKRIQPAR